MLRQERYDLITRNVNEVIGGDRIMSVLEKRNLKVYWGTAPTGRIHCGMTRDLQTKKATLFLS